MGADHPKPPRELREYLVLLRQRDSTGQPFIVVGGHAANFWGEFYSKREPRLKVLLPFVSKDLDLIGTEAEAARVAQCIGWYLSPPVAGGGPVQAIFEFRTESRRIGRRFPFANQRGFPRDHPRKCARGLSARAGNE